ncbi:glycosyltransferase [Thermincola potens]
MEGSLEFAMNPCKVLIGSAIRQKPAILKEFLQSLMELDRTNLQTDYFFIDNNDYQESAKLLREFRMEGSTVFLGAANPTEAYRCTEETHYWNDRLIWQIAAFKDHILKFALDNNYSHVFLVDSDLVLHPLTLKQLLSSGKDIISEIFWTEWAPGTGELPQVWITGQYSFHLGGNSMPEEEKQRQAAQVIAQLKVPGIYEVGGLGACTLISAKAIAKGISYRRISNVDYWGEDRHFCIRAAVLGFGLYVDTHYPAFHIYRESLLPKVAEYKRSIKLAKKKRRENRQIKRENWQRKSSGNKLTLSMIVRNEADRYLARVLAHARQYIDEAVIIDDASIDNTADICREILQGIPLTLITQKRSTFSTEYRLRKKQWRETVKTNPDWILILDADEMFEDKVVAEMPKLINQTEFDYYAFRLYDFWDEEHYREDKFWQAHKVYRPFLVRYIPGFVYKWLETPQHCGRFPCNITELKGALSPLRVKHFGWANPQDREKKYKRYLKFDPQGVYGIKEQYESILDPAPNLVRWEE